MHGGLAFAILGPMEAERVDDAVAADGLVEGDEDRGVPGPDQPVNSARSRATRVVMNFMGDGAASVVPSSALFRDLP